jgi:hypothetical protein
MSLRLFSLAGLMVCAVCACTSESGSPGDVIPDGAGAGADTGADVSDAAADQAADARLPDSGCAPGSSLYHQAAGCSLSAICLGDGQDACLGTYCGCDGITFTGGCDYATKPFAYRGPCADASGGGTGADADAAPVDACALGGDCDAGEEWDASACACVPHSSPASG